MIGEIIAIGDELISGRIPNSTSAYAARELFLLGHEIRAIHTIGDDAERIGTTLKAVIGRCDFVLVTGGLGPTTDDLTNEAVISALNLKAAVHPGVQANIAGYLCQNDANRLLAKLAHLPEGAEVLDASCRIAGYLLRYQGKPIYFLPGVPPQMETLLQHRVLPDLQILAAQQVVPTLPTLQQLYRTCGLPETEINRLLLPLEQENGLQLGYYPMGHEVHITLTIRDCQEGPIDARFGQADAFLRKALGPALYATGDIELAAVLGELVQAQGAMLCVAESCTGGLIGATITQIPGSSRWFSGDIIAYSNVAKEQLLGVGHELLVRHGAVSAEVARAMAAGAAARFGADLAVAVTGIAGPDGGSDEKPIGTVYLGLWQQGQLNDQLHHFRGNRRQIQHKTSYAALDMVRRALL